MTRTRKLALTLATSLALAGGAVWALRAPAAAPATTTSHDPIALVAPGLVEAHGDRVETGFEQSGRIVELLVDEGDRVVAGQVLARLDDRLARARVARAEAAVAAAKARLQLAERGARRQEIDAAAAEADAAAAQAWERGVARDRAEQLRERNADAIPLAEVDTARGAAQATEAQARAANARLSLLKKGTRVELIMEARAALAAAQAELDEANVYLSQMELRAPASGVVLRRLHEVGEQVSTMPPQTVLVLADLDRLELRAEVDEVDVARVALGQVGYATAEAFGDQRFAGKVTQIVGELGRKTQRLDDPRARVDTRVLEVVFTLDDPGALPLGLRMDVHLEPAPEAHTAAVTP
jgi:HlyD family secretion protein